MKQAWLKRILFYSALLANAAVVIVMIWFLYTKVYAPLFITNTSTVYTNQYSIPSAALERAKTTFTNKTTVTDDVTTLPNPFTSTHIGKVPSDTAGTPGITIKTGP